MYTYYFKSVSDYDIIFNALMDTTGPVNMDTNYHSYITPLDAGTDEKIYQLCDQYNIAC